MNNLLKIPSAHGRVYLWGEDGSPAEFTKSDIKKNKDGSVTTKTYSKRNDIAYYDGNCALFKDGSVLTWLEDAGVIPAPKDAEKVVQIASGGQHFIALRDDGKVICWGAKDTKIQTTVPPNLRDVVAVSASGYASHALSKDGDVISWGDKKETKHPKTLKDITQIRGAVGLTKSGKVVPWQVDDGNYICFKPPSNLPKIKTLIDGPGVITEDGAIRGIGYYASYIDAGVKGIKKKVKRAYINGGYGELQGAFLLFEDGTSEYLHLTKDPESENPAQYVNLKDYKNIIDLGVYRNVHTQGLWALIKE